jgi:hypothetical protein
MGPWPMPPASATEPSKVAGGISSGLSKAISEHQTCSIWSFDTAQVVYKKIQCKILKGLALIPTISGGATSNPYCLAHFMSGRATKFLSYCCVLQVVFLICRSTGPSNHCSILCFVVSSYSRIAIFGALGQTPAAWGVSATLGLWHCISKLRNWMKLYSRDSRGPYLSITQNSWQLKLFTVGDPPVAPVGSLYSTRATSFDSYFMDLYGILYHIIYITTYWHSRETL